MEQADLAMSTLVNTASIVLTVASLLAFSVWVRRWMRQGYVLPYQPRCRPPWGLAAGSLALLMTMMGVVNALAMRMGEVEEIEFDAESFVQSQFAMGGLQLAFVAVILVVLTLGGGARLRDMGWPTSVDELGSDLRLGGWVALASMIPLYTVQLLAILLLGIPAEHPILTQMAMTPDPMVFVAAIFSAAVVAPLFEELVYRMLLQGGLERWEDDLVAWPLSNEHERPRVELAAPEPTDEAAEYGHRIAPGSELLEDSLSMEDLAPVEPGGVGVMAGLGHGWMPILISSFLFALAHLGAGPSPIALFVFALFLGYTYQRTHRILPCIVAHFALNLLSLVALMLTAGMGEG